MNNVAGNLLVRMPMYKKNFRITQRISGREAAQYRVLDILMKSGPHSMSEIDQLLNISKSSMTALIDSLKEKGWIKRENKPEDRRVGIINITPDGKKHLRHAFEVDKTVMKALPAGEGNEDLEKLCTSPEYLQRVFLEN